MGDKDFKSFLQGSAISVAGMALFGVVNYLVRRTLALGLPLDAYGFVYAVLSLLSLCLALMEFGTSKAGTILIARHMACGQKGRAELAFGSLLGFNSLAGAGMALLLAALSYPLCSSFFHYPSGLEAFLLFLPFVAASAFESSFITCLNAMKSYLAYNIALNIRALILLGGCLLFAKSCGMDAVALAFLASSLASAGFAWIFLRKCQGMKALPLAFFQAPATRERLFGLGVWVAVSNAGLACIYHMNSLCLVALGGLQDVALYNVALPIMQIVQSMALVLPMVFTPIATEMLAKGRRVELRRHVLALSLGLLALLPPTLVAGHFLSGWIITLLFSAEFVGAARTVTILWAGMLFFTAAQIHFNALNAGGRAKSVAVYTGLGAALNLILCLCLIPRFGIEGAAFATAAAYLGIAVCSFREFWQMSAEGASPSKSA